MGRLGRERGRERGMKDDGGREWKGGGEGGMGQFQGRLGSGMTKNKPKFVKDSLKQFALAY